jgi:hypothetical protein
MRCCIGFWHLCVSLQEKAMHFTLLCWFARESYTIHVTTLVFLLLCWYTIESYAFYVVVVQVLVDALV